MALPLHRAAAPLAAMALFIGAAPVAAAPASTDESAPAAVAGRGWQATELPLTDGWFFDVATPDAHSTWAVGLRDGDRLSPLMYAKDDRDGKGWREVPTAPTSAFSRMNSVDGVSARDGLMVGDYDEDLGGILTEHWDGERWRAVVAEAAPDTLAADLLGVDMLSPDDGWAVGSSQILDELIPLPDGGVEVVDHREGMIQHWNGTSWEPVPLPDVAESWNLQSVTARAADDVWAVGFAGSTGQPVALHYDGEGWEQVRVPPYGGGKADLTDVVVKGKKEVWLVGARKASVDAELEGLVLRYDGRSWSRVPLPGASQGVRAAQPSRGGITVLGAYDDEDVPSVLRYAHGAWTSLDLPTDGKPSWSVPTLHVSGGRTMVTALRFDSEGEDAGSGRVTILTRRS